MHIRAVIRSCAVFLISKMCESLVVLAYVLTEYSKIELSRRLVVSGPAQVFTTLGWRSSAGRPAVDSNDLLWLFPRAMVEKDSASDYRPAGGYHTSSYGTAS